MTGQQPAPQRGLLVIHSALMLALPLAALDQTIVATALPTIVSDLGGLSHLSKPPATPRPVTSPFHTVTESATEAC